MSWGVGFSALSASRRFLKESILSDFTEQAMAIMDEISRSMRSHIAEWKSFSQEPLVQRILRDSNRQFDELSDKQGYIDDRDAAWRSTEKDKLSPLMKELSSTELSIGMRKHITVCEEEHGYPIFGEVFITNRHGVNVALTNHTSDYRQDDEEWWQRASRDGLYVGDVGFDESANIFSTDICLRIDDEDGAFMGVMKVVFDIHELVHIIGHHSDKPGMDSHHHLVWCNSTSSIIYALDFNIVPLSDGTAYFHDGELPRRNRGISMERVDPNTGERFFSIYVTSCAHHGLYGLDWTLSSNTRNQSFLGHWPTCANKSSHLFS